VQAWIAFFFIFIDDAAKAVAQKTGATRVTVRIKQ
jgi:hypothetical protein